MTNPQQIFLPGFGANCHQRSQGHIPVCAVTDITNTRIIFSNAPLEEEFDARPIIRIPKSPQVSLSVTDPQTNQTLNTPSTNSATTSSNLPRPPEIIEIPDPSLPPDIRKRKVSDWRIVSARAYITRFFSASTAFFTLACELPSLDLPPGHLPHTTLPPEIVQQYTSSLTIAPEDEVIIYFGYLPTLRPITFQDISESRLLRTFVGSIDTISATGTIQGIMITVQCRDRVKYLMDTQVRLSTFELAGGQGGLIGNLVPNDLQGADTNITITPSEATTASDIGTVTSIDSGGPVNRAFSFYMEQRDGECQATSVAMALRAAGRTELNDPHNVLRGNRAITPENVMRVAGRGDKEAGRRHLQDSKGNHINGFLRGQGVSATLLPSINSRPEAVRALKRELDAGRVVVVQNDMTKDGHVVLVTGYNDRGFIVQDPYGKWNGTLFADTDRGLGYTRGRNTGRDVVYGFDQFGASLVTRNGNLVANSVPASRELVNNGVVGNHRNPPPAQVQRAVGSFIDNVQLNSAIANSGYNPKLGQLLFNRAVKINPNTVGWCYRAVADVIDPQVRYLWGRSAFMAADQLAKSRYFVEIQVPPNNLRNIPVGAVVVYNRSSGFNPTHGHILIADGKGNGISDHKEGAIRITPAGTFRVFLPRDTPIPAIRRQLLTRSFPASSAVNNRPSINQTTAPNVSQGASTAVSTPGFDALRQYIGKKESNNNYDVANTGHAGSIVQGYRVSTKTIRQLMADQAANRVFAVGKYQMVPVTLREFVEFSGISKDTVFSPIVQEQAFLYLMSDKRPQLRDFLMGRHNNVNLAQRELALEFASIMGPEGRGAYDGDSAGNRASGTAAEVRQLLINARAEISANPGMLNYRDGRAATLPGNAFNPSVVSGQSNSTYTSAPGSTTNYSGRLPRSALILTTARLGIGHVNNTQIVCQIGGIKIQAPDPSKGQLFDLELGSIADPDVFYESILKSTTVNPSNVEIDPVFHIQVGRRGLNNDQNFQRLLARSLSLINQVPINVIRFLATQEPYPTEVFQDQRTGNYFYCPRACDVSALRDQDPARFARTYYFRNVPEDVKAVDANQMLISFKQEFTSLGTKTNFIVAREDTSSPTITRNIFLHATMRPNFLINKRIASKITHVVDNTIENISEAAAVALSMAKITAKEGRVGLAVMLGDPSLTPGEMIQVIGSPLYPIGLKKEVYERDRTNAIAYNDKFKATYKSLAMLVKEGRTESTDKTEEGVIIGTNEPEDISGRERPQNVIRDFLVRPLNGTETTNNLTLVCSAQDRASMVEGSQDYKSSGFLSEPHTIYRIEGVIHEFNSGGSRGYETHVALLSPF